jgi:hypothetical protein
MKYNGIPTHVKQSLMVKLKIIIVAGAADTMLAIKLSCFWNDYNYKFIMGASSDNVAVTGYNVYQGVHLKRL